MTLGAFKSCQPFKLDLATGVCQPREALRKEGDCLLGQGVGRENLPLGTCLCGGNQETFIRTSTNAPPRPRRKSLCRLPPSNTLTDELHTEKLRVSQGNRSPRGGGHSQGTSAWGEQSRAETEMQTCLAWDEHGRHSVLCLGGHKTGLVPPRLSF